MADIKKFLNQDGVSVLWCRIAEEVKKVDDKAVEETQSEDKLYMEGIDNEDIIKEIKGTTRKKLRKKL